MRLVIVIILSLMFFPAMAETNNRWSSKDSIESTIKDVIEYSQQKGLLNIIEGNSSFQTLIEGFYKFNGLMISVANFK
jgi:hypothetical protein